MRFQWGAVPAAEGLWTFSLWSPAAETVAVELGDQRQNLDRADNGWWSSEIAAETGTAYRFCVDGEAYPDPSSRLQQGNVHAPSLLCDHTRYHWSAPWWGRPWEEAVIYELHIGTFTLQGTFAAAAEKLARLVELGITAIEIMPIGQWGGDRGWGYDGVLPFAPHPAYGSPDDLKALVETAHNLGLMVILDFVMNHFGPDGSYIHAIAPNFFDEERHTPWGAAIDFSQDAVREFWCEAATMWIRDYHLDGIRFDAVHEITGPGAEDFLLHLGDTLRGLELDRPIHLITEDERNEPQLREGPYDAAWNDDFHHALHTALTGEGQSYYASFAVDPIGDLALALQRGHVEEGQEREGRDEPRGKPSAHLPMTAFVNATQNHDQVGNRMGGERLLELADGPGVEVAYATMLLAPFIPMIFMGEERGETAPFLFFVDYHDELGEKVRQGREEEFPEFADGSVPDPLAEGTFEQSKLTWRTDEHAMRWLDLTGRCTAFRQQHIVPLLKSGRSGEAEVSRIGKSSLHARWFFHGGTLEMHLNFGEVNTAFPRTSDARIHVNDIHADPFSLLVQVHPK